MYLDFIKQTASLIIMLFYIYLYVHVCHISPNLAKAVFFFFICSFLTCCTEDARALCDH